MSRNYRVVAIAVAISVSLASWRAPAADGILELRKGDRISVIGNCLAERMQHDGWLETLIQARFPQHELSYRDLGYSADELTVRQRVDGFGSQDEWLAKCKTDVLFVFFGFNESFAGESGLPKFKNDLDAFLKKTLKASYNGKDAPRIVLFSPTAFENLKGQPTILAGPGTAPALLLPDGAEHNARLRMYTAAMSEVAKANSVPFVDIFAPSAELYAREKEPLTMNGAHLNELGNRRLAQTIDNALFGKQGKAGTEPGPTVEKLRQAVLEKNVTWFNRYRPTDDYNIFGGRSSLSYQSGSEKAKVSNYSVLMREMEILEVQSANRDKKVWAVAGGRGDAKVDDANVPPFIEVKTNRPGKRPDGSYDFISGEEAISQMTLAEGLKANLFASEEMFPELANPVQMAFDTKGRLWVAVWPNYPHWKPRTPLNDKLLILEDTDGDGKADKCKVFAGDLRDPTGFEFYNGGVLVSQMPDLVFLKDTDGDDKADLRERVVAGLSAGDSHHAANSFAVDPGGALYFGEGVFHRSQVESIYGPVRNTDACMWRFEPRTFKVERYVPYGFANPHGNVFDRWGQHFIHDGTGANPYHADLFSGHLDAGKKHSAPPGLYKQRTRPCPGTEILSSRHFPLSMQGTLLVGNVITVQGILQYKIAPDGASFTGTEVERTVDGKQKPDTIVTSSDPNFRPSDMEIGPDGALYFTDWHKPLIGHMQHHIRDPNRDQQHGRVYRVTYPARPLLKPVKIAGEPIERLVDLLIEPENRVRFRARLELSARESDKVLAAVQGWLKTLDRNDPDYEHHRMEALWLHQFHGVPNVELLKSLLRSPDHNARAAATRVLCYTREQVGEALTLLRAQAEDEHPLVRMAAVRAASFFNSAEAADAALLALKQPMDKYLQYTFGETMKQLEPHWTEALKKGEPVAKGNPAGAAYILEKVKTPELLKMARTAAVNSALLSRHGIPEASRIEALDAMAKQNGTNIVTELLNAMERAEKSSDGHAAHIVEELARILVARPAPELAAAAERIKTLAKSAKTAALRAAVFAAWITADGNDTAAYEAASKSVAGLGDYLGAVQYVRDDKLRASLYPHVRPLMFEVPQHLAGSAERQPTGATGPARAGSGLSVSLYKFLAPNAALETFKDKKPDYAGVIDRFTLDVPKAPHSGQFALVFTGTLIVPKQGKYTFYIGSDDGSRLYLDNKLLVDNDGPHGMETKSKAIDLKAGSHPIAATYFNSGGGEGLEVSWKGPGFEQKPIAGAALGASGGGGGGSLQDEAIRAVTRIPGNEGEKFNDYAKLIADPQRRAAAVAAIRALPKQHWPAAQAPRVVDIILAYLTSQPASERTKPAAVDALNLGRDLAALLPKEESEKAQARLQTLNVDVVLIRPIPHQMLYDHKRFFAEAGKPVEVVFENTDVMPHNLVIVAPDAMLEVGQAAEEMGPPGEAKGFIPATPKVLWHTKLLVPGQSQRLSFTAPKEEGEYPFVCTFPGHYLVMNGVMQVVKEKTAAHVAEATLHADVPQRPFVKMWEMKDLEPELAGMAKGRSLPRGKEMFDVAGCVKCHTLAGQGGKTGPDLSEVTKKYKGQALLKQIIEPSSEINEQFRSFLIITKDGRRVSGAIAKEDDKTVEVNTNPLAPDGIVKLSKSEIQTRKPSPLSLMPPGLLVTLSKDEILDLLNYVESGGAQK